MPCRLLEDSIASLQREYRDLLMALLPDLRSQNAISSLDEINIFWHSNMGLVRLYLDYIVSNSGSYVFTASTCMDTDQSEQYPFMLLGNAHIVDDPLGSYSELVAGESPGVFADVLREQIALAATEDVRVLEKSHDRIVVLPFRLLSQNHEDPSLYEAGEKAFVSLFENISDLKDYFAKCESFEDILKYARKDMGDTIVLTEHDNRTKPFSDRFQNAVQELDHMFENGWSEARKFFQIVYGYIQQSVDILASCVRYNCTPYIRHQPSLVYFMLLSENFVELTNVSSMRYKACIAHLIYCICDAEKLRNADFDNYCRLVSETRFQDVLFSSLAEAGVTEHDFSPNRIAPILNKRLDELYAALFQTTVD